MDLEQDVAQLVQQLRVVALVSRVGELVGLLDRVRDDRALVLLAVPGTLAPQPARDRIQSRYRFSGGLGCVAVAQLRGRRWSKRDCVFGAL